MPNEIVLQPALEIDRADRLAELENILQIAEDNREAGLSENTRKAYASQWRAFERWCAHMGLPAMPTDARVLLAYMTDRQRRGSSTSTLGQAYAAIREEHRTRGHTPPLLDGELHRSWIGARKKAARSKAVEKASALSPAALKQIVAFCEGPNGPRDRAMLLIGWCGAMRGDEIVNLDFRDIRVTPEGLRVTIRYSKTDQMSQGHEIGIHRAENPDHCPVAAWEAFAGPPEPGDTGDYPAFPSRTGMRLHPEDIGRILLRRMKQAGMPTAGFSSHSLRAGCITAAAAAGHPIEAIQRQSRHKTLEVLLGYIRTATLFQGNVTKGML